MFTSNFESFDQLYTGFWLRICQKQFEFWHSRIEFTRRIAIYERNQKFWIDSFVDLFEPVILAYKPLRLVQIWPSYVIYSIQQLCRRAITRDSLQAIWREEKLSPGTRVMFDTKIRLKSRLRRSRMTHSSRAKQVLRSWLQSSRIIRVYSTTIWVHCLRWHGEEFQILGSWLPPREYPYQLPPIITHVFASLPQVLYQVTGGLRGAVYDW